MICLVSLAFYLFLAAWEILTLCLPSVSRNIKFSTAPQCKYKGQETNHDIILFIYSYRIVLEINHRNRWCLSTAANNKLWRRDTVTNIVLLAPEILIFYIICCLLHLLNNRPGSVLKKLSLVGILNLAKLFQFILRKHYWKRRKFWLQYFFMFPKYSLKLLFFSCLKACDYLLSTNERCTIDQVIWISGVLEAPGQPILIIDWA